MWDSEDYNNWMPNNYVKDLLYNLSNQKLIDLSTLARKLVIVNIRKFFRENGFISEKQRKLLAIWIMEPKWFNKWKRNYNEN